MSARHDQGRIEFLQGTLDLLILRPLRVGPAHGHAIAKAIELRSDDVLQVALGSPYPALHRLIKRGSITFEDGRSEINPKAEFHRLRQAGRQQLAVETSKWERVVRAIARVVRPA